MEQIKLLKYPEQVKSLKRLLLSMDKVYYQVERTTESNVERLKKVVWNEPDLFLYLIADNEETDDFTLISEMWLISSILCEEKFLRLLAKCSLTNRIIMSYRTQEMSESLRYRIRECIVAFDVYSTMEEYKNNKEGLTF